MYRFVPLPSRSNTASKVSNRRRTNILPLPVSMRRLYEPDLLPRNSTPSRSFAASTFVVRMHCQCQRDLLFLVIPMVMPIQLPTSRPQTPPTMIAYSTVLTPTSHSYQVHYNGQDDEGGEGASAPAGWINESSGRMGKREVGGGL